MIDGTRLLISALSQQGGGNYRVATIGFAAASILIGLGLIARIELIRRIVVVFACLGILGGLLTVWGGLWGSLLLGLWGFLLVVIGIINVTVNALMIYLIGETSRQVKDL
jgi:hypothetical protein